MKIVKKEIEWEEGCEDIKLAQCERGTYYLKYTGYNGDKLHLVRQILKLS